MYYNGIKQLFVFELIMIPYFYKYNYLLQYYKIYINFVKNIFDKNIIFKDQKYILIYVYIYELRFFK
jgi:hypothetical protein